MRSEKLHLVNLIGNQISNADYVYFITYGGMTVQQLSDLRVELDKVGAECHIYKNTLIRKAGELLKVDALATFPLTNDTALIFGQGDAGAAAKVIIEYGKKLDKVAPKGGYFEGNVLSKEEVENIASLPAKDPGSRRNPGLCTGNPHGGIRYSPAADLCGRGILPADEGAGPVPDGSRRSPQGGGSGGSS